MYYCKYSIGSISWHCHGARTYLPWVLPLHALHWHPLWPGAWVRLLGHPLAVAPEGSHALGTRLVHAHGRAAHAGRVHAAPTAAHGVHVARQGWWSPPGPRLVHELATVLVGSHLERGTHL